VAVESAVGEGSCFTVWLPTRAAAQEAPARALPLARSRRRRRAHRAGRRGRLPVRRADPLQLEAEGFTVIHAASAEAALVMALQQPLSLITLDIMLPNMDGWEFLGRIKQGRRSIASRS
jgi:hypothetical protein